MIFYILITCRLDNVLILLGEIRMLITLSDVGKTAFPQVVYMSLFIHVKLQLTEPTIAQYPKMTGSSKKDLSSVAT